MRDYSAKVKDKISLQNHIQKSVQISYDHLIFWLVCLHITWFGQYSKWIGIAVLALTKILQSILQKAIFQFHAVLNIYAEFWKFHTSSLFSMHVLNWNHKKSGIVRRNLLFNEAEYQQRMKPMDNQWPQTKYNNK